MHALLPMKCKSEAAVPRICKTHCETLEFLKLNQTAAPFTAFFKQEFGFKCL